jgi:hypothetical protein
MSAPSIFSVAPWPNSLESEAGSISLNHAPVFYRPENLWSAAPHAWDSSDLPDSTTLQNGLGLVALPDHRSWVWLGNWTQYYCIVNIKNTIICIWNIVILIIINIVNIKKIIICVIIIIIIIIIIYLINIIIFIIINIINKII